MAGTRLLAAASSVARTVRRFRIGGTLLRDGTPYLLLAPSLLLVAGVLGYPTVRVLHFSILKWSFGRGLETAKPVGLENYIWLLQSPSSTLLHSLQLSLLYSGISLAAEVCLGLAIASLLNSRISGRPLILTGLIIPTLLMPAMVGMMWRLYFYPNGIVDFVLRTVFRLDINWYTSQWAMPAVILVEIWQYAPFFILSFFTGLQMIPGELLEAAAVDGATGWQRFVSIILPLLLPVIAVTVVIRLMWLLKAFDVIYAMFTGGPGSSTEVLGLSIYRTLFLARSIGRSAAISIILSLISLAFALGFVKIVYSSRAMEEQR